MRAIVGVGVFACMAAWAMSCGSDEDGSSSGFSPSTTGAGNASSSEGGEDTTLSSTTGPGPQSGSGTGASAAGGAGTAGSGGASGGTGGGKDCQSQAECNDGLYCNGLETCSGGTCQPGTSPCNDGIPCTVDGCDEAADQCTHDADDSLCDNGADCDGVEFCDPANGCQSTGNTCDDGIDCTVDQCDVINDVCTHSANHGACDNGVYCDGDETCNPVTGDPVTGCVDGTSVVCNDNIGCTADACDEAAAACGYTPNDSLCAPGELCVPGQGCITGVACSTNAQCSDGNACNGIETCNVVCHPGTPVNCNDGIQCTTDTCNPANGQCSHQANNVACDDGLACTGTETCSPQTGCVAGTPIDCSDAVACTFDQCQEPGTCAHLPVDFLCDDGQVCNGSETCTPAGCQAGGPVVCPPDSDDFSCTAGACDPILNSCKSVPDDDLCPCGQTCNPTLGQPPSGCGFFCVQADCQGKLYECGECVDNDGDCKIDSADASCLGPCDNTETSFYGGIPGQANSPCKQDCYFDKDSGAGNDDCYWSHECDTHEVPPNYAPEPSECAYNPNVSIPGYSGTCADAFATQSAQCLGYCLPLTPNGCDCFGCCTIPGAPTTVWLGSENPNDVGSCSLTTVSDPTMCKPCTQVPSCINPCGNCEICVGKTELPIECIEQECPAGKQKCGLPGQLPCPTGSSCITGCCQLNPG